MFYGWWIVAISFVVNALTTGVYWLGFSVLFLPISRDLGISRAAASLPFTLRGVVGAVQSPLVGLLVDRMGPAKVLFFGAIAGGLGFVLLSRVEAYIVFAAVFLGVLSPGMMSFDAPTTAATGRWFARKRGLAMSIAYMGFAFGGSVVTPLLALAVDRIDWRAAALISGVSIWAVTLPLATRLYRSPESRGLLPDGDDSAAVGAGLKPAPTADSLSPPTAAPRDFGLRDAASTPAYWMLCLSCGLRAMVFMGMSLHLVAIMTWKGLDEATAGLLVGAFAFVWLAATPVMGWVGDRWYKTKVAAAPAFLGSVAMVLLLLLDEVEAWQMALVLGLWATNEGSWPLNFAILADQFGVRNYGALRGGMLMVVNLMSFGAPFYSGWMFDRTGGYQWVVLPAAVLLGVAGLLNWLLPEDPRPGQAEARRRSP